MGDIGSHLLLELRLLALFRLRYLPGEPEYRKEGYTSNGKKAQYNPKPDHSYTDLNT